MMTDAEFNYLKEKIERQFPIRLRLAELAGRKRINVKKHQELMDFDDTIVELLQEVQAKKPENLSEAMSLAEKETEWKPTP
jgi:hypothetical protein